MSRKHDKPRLQQILDEIAQQMGLKEGVDYDKDHHPYACNCAKCREFWNRVGKKGKDNGMV